MKDPVVTFVLFTFNEEKRIAFAVKNFIKYGPVLLLDGGSTDRTQEIAESLGARFLKRPQSARAAVETKENLDFIKENSETDWIYWGYCDNIAPRTLVAEMVRVAADDRFKKVNLPLFTYLWGDTDNVAQKSYLPALFHKDFIDFSHNQIHSFGEFLGEDHQILTLPATPAFALRHFSTYNVAKYVTGYMRYGEEEARQKFERGERFSVVKLLAAMVRYLWIYRRALRSPRLGLLIALNMAFGRLMTYTRLYEYEHGITLDSIEEAYAKKKRILLEDFD